MKLTKEQINKALNSIKIEGVHPCSVIEADFERDEVTLKMQGDYKVSVGPMLLVRVGSVADDKALEQHRAEFEEWAGSKADKSRGENYYKDFETQYDWTIWKAARGISE